MFEEVEVLVVVYFVFDFEGLECCLCVYWWVYIVEVLFIFIVVSFFVIVRGFFRDLCRKLFVWMIVLFVGKEIELFFCEVGINYSEGNIVESVVLSCEEWVFL